MQRTAPTAVFFTSIAASVVTLVLALSPALTQPDVGAPLRVVELPRVVVSAARAAPQVVELERVVVQARRLAAPAASVAGLAQPLLPVLARQPN